MHMQAYTNKNKKQEFRKSTCQELDSRFYFFVNVIFADNSQPYITEIEPKPRNVTNWNSLEDWFSFFTSHRNWEILWRKDGQTSASEMRTFSYEKLLFCCVLHLYLVVTGNWMCKKWRRLLVLIPKPLVSKANALTLRPLQLLIHNNVLI